MKRFAAAVLAGLLFAAHAYADATMYWVRPNSETRTSSDNNLGRDSTDAFATIQAAINHAFAKSLETDSSQIVMVLGGSYTGTFNCSPNNNWGVAATTYVPTKWVRVIGDTANPGNVTITGGADLRFLGAKGFSVRGFSFESSASSGGPASVLFSSDQWTDDDGCYACYTDEAAYDSVAYCWFNANSSADSSGIFRFDRALNRQASWRYPAQSDTADWTASHHVYVSNVKFVGRQLYFEGMRGDNDVPHRQKEITISDSEWQLVNRTLNTGQKEGGRFIHMQGVRNLDFLRNRVFMYASGTFPGNAVVNKDGTPFVFNGGDANDYARSYKNAAGQNAYEDGSYNAVQYTRFFAVQLSRFYDNYFDFNGWRWNNYSRYESAWYMRDSTYRNLWVRDTFYVSGSESPEWAFNVHSANNPPGVAHAANGHSRYDHCLWINPKGRGPKWHTSAYSDTLQYCMVAAQRRALVWDDRAGAGIDGNVLIDHCTLVDSLPSVPTVSVGNEKDQLWTGGGRQIKFTNNAIIKRGTYAQGTAQSPYEILLRGGMDLRADYNFVQFNDSTSAQGDRSIGWYEMPATGTAYRSYYARHESKPDAAPWSQQTHSMFAPQDVHSTYMGRTKKPTAGLADSTIGPTFDATIDTTSGLYAAGEGGSDIGAYQVVVADSVRPDNVTNLVNVGESETSVLFKWTTTGDDSLTGTARFYRFFYTSGTMGESEADTCASYTAPEVPRVSGTIEYVEVYGLSPGTGYNFAMRVYDEYGNRSAISNTQFVTTRLRYSSGGGTGVTDTDDAPSP